MLSDEVIEAIAKELFIASSAMIAADLYKKNHEKRAEFIAKSPEKWERAKLYKHKPGEHSTREYYMGRVRDVIESAEAVGVGFTAPQSH